MKTEWRIFGLVSLFLYVAFGVYAWWTHHDLGQIDWVGSMALLLSGTLCLMCGAYFLLVARRIQPRPEDRPDGEISEGAGEIGFFSPGSYWPFGLALAAAAAGMGMVFMMWWLIAAGLVAVVLATCGLLFEYYSGSRRPAEH